MISLGINYSGLHDSAACIVRDGQVLFAVAEERLSRLKHDSGFPIRAIRSCLDFANVEPSDLDCVCQSWPLPGTQIYHDLKCMLTGKQPISYIGLASLVLHGMKGVRDRGGQKSFRRCFGESRAQFRWEDHHLSHAISAYAMSGFDDSAVLVIDGRGAWEATSLWHGRDGRLERMWTIPWPNSLGLFYARFTEYLGFTPYSDEWKVMGLAPYGEAGVDLRAFLNPDKHPYRVDSRMLLRADSRIRALFESRLGPARIPESELETRHKDLAFAVQDLCEVAMLNLARIAVRQAGTRNLCLAGGVALNSKANGKILSSGIVDRIFVQPAAGDDGACIGAALAPYLDHGGSLPMTEMRHAYLGPECSETEIESAFQACKLRPVRLSDPAGVAAALLEKGKIIGWFQGRMEFGPRALGNRSILADPRDPKMTEKVNNAVKFREWWRPFAPSVLSESAHEFFESATDSPFMILTAQVRPEKRNVIPAVTHIDGSARPQTVERDVSPLYWRLISEFGRRTGVPVVLNTSFNLRGEPIVNSVFDAVRTFFTSGMDALVIGHFLVEKETGTQVG